MLCQMLLYLLLPLLHCRACQHALHWLVRVATAQQLPDVQTQCLQPPLPQQQ
jgi:hypothetical protein